MVCPQSQTHRWSVLGSLKNSLGFVRLECGIEPRINPSSEPCVKPRRRKGDRETHCAADGPMVRLR